MSVQGATAILRLMLAALALLLAAAAPAQAGWPAQGGQLNTDSGSDFEADQALTRVGGVSWIAWTERPAGPLSPSQVRAARWTGSAWEPTGPVHADLAHDASEPTLANAAGVPVVAWTETVGGEQHVRVAKWTGTAWSAIGGRVDAVEGRAPALVDIPNYWTDGDPLAVHIAYVEEGSSGTELYVKRWTGTAWGEDYVPQPTTSDVSDPVLAIDWGLLTVGWVAGGTAHVAYPRSTDYPASGWHEIGPLNTTHPASKLALAEYGSALAVAWTEEVAPGRYRLRAATTPPYTEVRSLVRAASGHGGWMILGDSGEADSPVAPTPAIADAGTRVWAAWDVGGAIQVFDASADGWYPVGTPLRRDPGAAARAVTLVSWQSSAPVVSWVERPGAAPGATSDRVFAAGYAVDAESSRIEFSADAQNVTENGQLAVTVRRTGTVTRAAAAYFGVSAKAPESADPGEDFPDHAWHARFNAGQSETTVLVAVKDDAVHEADKTFELSLYGALGDAAINGRTTMLVTVTDDDPANVGGESGDGDGAPAAGVVPPAPTTPTPAGAFQPQTVAPQPKAPALGTKPDAKTKQRVACTASLRGAAAGSCVPRVTSAAPLACPVGAVCTLRVQVSIDGRAAAGTTAVVRLSRPQAGDAPAAVERRCTAPGATRKRATPGCQITATLSAIAPGSPLTAACSASAVPRSVARRAARATRKLRCIGTLTIRR